MAHGVKTFAAQSGSLNSVTKTHRVRGENLSWNKFYDPAYAYHSLHALTDK